ncbi:MAG: hypothetical protein AB8I08_06315 [Sandaracinaceae bacterium]
MRLASRLVLPLLLWGCAVERPLDWTFQIPDGLERPGTVVVARIREGGCRDGDPVIYESRPRSTSGQSAELPELVENTTYCFQVSLTDADCTIYASGSQTVEVGPEEMPVVALTLSATTEVTCEGVCRPDRGCFLCDTDTQFLCPARESLPARCCATGVTTCSEDAFFCDTFEE